MSSSISQSIRAISFDVGGTLIDPWPSVGHVYAEVAEEMGLGCFDPVALNNQFAAAWRAQRAFNYSRAEWADIVVRTCGRPASEIGLGSPFFARLYDRFTQPSAWRIYEDVLPTLAQLRSRGLKLAVVSNWDDRLRLLLRNLALDHFFSAIEISAESGFHKPAPEIFRRALDTLRLTPSAVLHVGDLQLEDFEGARAAGLQSVLLRRGQDARSADEIGSLRELVARPSGD